MTKTEKIAREFSRLLKEKLATKSNQLIRELNRPYIDLFEAMVRQNIEKIEKGDITHEYLNSKEVMAEAFEHVMGYEADGMSDVDIELWEKAWQLADESNFYEF